MPIGGDPDFVHRRRVRPKPVGYDAARRAAFLQDPPEKLQRRGIVPSCRDHRLQDFAFMIDGAPEVAELAIDLHKDLIQVPTPLRMVAHVRHSPLANLGGEHWAKPVPPEPDRLVADVDSALG